MKIVAITQICWSKDGTFYSFVDEEGNQRLTGNRFDYLIELISWFDSGQTTLTFFHCYLTTQGIVCESDRKPYLVPIDILRKFVVMSRLEGH